MARLVVWLDVGFFTSQSSLRSATGALIKGGSFTWQVVQGWCFPGQAALGMLYMGMCSSTHLSQVKLSTKREVNFMTIVPSLLKVLPIRIVVDVDGLHVALQGASWRRKSHQVQVHRPFARAGAQVSFFLG